MFVKLGSVTVEKVYDQNAFSQRMAKQQKIVEYDPSFVYVAVRALSADKPNSNGDCFPHEELIRKDAVLDRPVYASFISKGLYINHKDTNDPTIAKGVVLDARYVDANAEDRYVELLIGVDRNRDKVFAENVERGLINKFSMGASVQMTKCSVCDNEARRKEDFCEHIAKSKMRECRDKQGQKKLAYEKCYGVTFNEISAVSDPADETAQLLAKIANKSEENSAKSAFGTVVLSKDLIPHIKNLEAAVMKKRASVKKVALPIEESGVTPGGGAEVPTPEDVPMDTEGPEGMGPGPDMGPELNPEQAEVVDVLRVVTDMIEGTLPPEQAVEELTNLVGPSDVPAEVPPGEEVGAPEPEPVDMGMQARRRAAFLRFVEKMAEKRGGSKVTKVAEDKGEKIKGQYPDYKVQKAPTQHHTKPFKERPKSDFSKSQKELDKLLNLCAKFVANDDRTKAAWQVMDGDKPLYVVTGGRAYGELLDQQWDVFASRQYGEELIRTIAERGLEQTMRHVNAYAVEQTKKVAADDAEIARWMKAAEAKASDLADEKVAEFKERFLDGLRYAFKLQSKNVIENPIKAAAFDVLAAHGANPALAEKIAEADIVEMHFDEAMKKALEYTEMSSDAFEEVKAHIDSLPATNVLAARESGMSDDDIAEIEADNARQALRRRAGMPTVRTASGETAQTKFEDRVASAVRVGLRPTVVPSGVPYRVKK